MSVPYDGQGYSQSYNQGPYQASTEYDQPQSYQAAAQYGLPSQSYVAESYTAYGTDPSHVNTHGEPVEGERGLFGGALGAVAGGSAGSQLSGGKGILGALGGGAVGSIIEDIIKKKKSKQDVCRPTTPQPAQVCQPPQQIYYAQPPPQQHCPPQQYQQQAHHGGGGGGAGFIIGAGAGGGGGHSNGYTQGQPPIYKY